MMTFLLPPVRYYVFTGVIFRETSYEDVTRHLPTPHDTIEKNRVDVKLVALTFFSIEAC